VSAALIPGKAAANQFPPRAKEGSSGFRKKTVVRRISAVDDDGLRARGNNATRAEFLYRAIFHV
jgi:hypothetical protein